MTHESTNETKRLALVGFTYEWKETDSKQNTSVGFITCSKAKGFRKTQSRLRGSGCRGKVRF